LPALIKACIAFTVTLWTAPKGQVKQSATPFIHIDKTVDPLMTDGLIGPFQLQTLTDLLWAKALLQPDRKMRVQPYFRLAECVCTALANVTLLVSQDRLVGRFRPIAANVSTDLRGKYTQLFVDANLGACHSPNQGGCPASV
jgi:hypothetical protein